MCVFCLHVCVCTECVSGVWGCQKVVSNHLELEWTTMWVPGANPGSSKRAEASRYKFLVFMELSTSGICYSSGYQFIHKTTPSWLGQPLKVLTFNLIVSVNIQILSLFIYLSNIIWSCVFQRTCFQNWKLIFGILTIFCEVGLSLTWLFLSCGFLVPSDDRRGLWVANSSFLHDNHSSSYRLQQFHCFQRRGAFPRQLRIQAALYVPSN